MLGRHRSGLGVEAGEHLDQPAGGVVAEDDVEVLGGVPRRLLRAREELGREKVRELLVATGSPQTDGPHGPARQRIGPRPDLRRALEARPRCEATRLEAP